MNPRIIALSTIVLLTVNSYAASVVYSINADGIKEVTAGGVPNQGDLDGSAIGTVQLDDGTGGLTGFAVINVTLANLAYPLSGWHIHQAPATTTGSIVLNFGSPETYRTGDVLSAVITGLSSATIDAVFANPSGYYFNIHNSVYPGGAVRDQLVAVPEPAMASLALLGAAAFVCRRYQRQK